MKCVIVTISTAEENWSNLIKGSQVSSYLESPRHCQNKIIKKINGNGRYLILKVILMVKLAAAKMVIRIK